jgi:nitrite reductase/ring-hydroxylating ferredoxin subunit
VKWYKIFRDETEANMAIPEGSMRVIRVVDTKICLAHTQSGYYAIQNTCPHLGDSLANGHLNHLDEITCPWHAYRFSLKNGREVMQRCSDAKTYSVKVNQEGMFLGISETNNP